MNHRTGAFTLFCVERNSSIDGVPFTGRIPGSDELLVTHLKAVSRTTIKIPEETILYCSNCTVPDINPDVPFLTKYGI